MKHVSQFLLSAFTVLLVLISSLPASAQVPPEPMAESPAQHDARMAWFRDARFGMFIHWGVYSVPAGEWQGNKNHAEWIMETGKIPVSTYETFSEQFNPVKFDAGEWVRMAKDAGMKYIVITSKHHDGFGLWDSKLTDWDIGRTPFNRDPLKELAEACQEEGIRLCFYHSIMDWHHPDWGTRRAWNDLASGTPDMDRYTDYMKGQLKELLTGYGPIGIVWFDGEWESPWTHERGVDLYNYCRELQPGAIINNRVGKGRAGMAGMDEGRGVGDYGTPEQEIPATGFGPGVDWESCMTMNDHWGYNKNDQHWKSTQTLIRNLIDCASKGGNYLLNIGPTAEGLFPPASIERLAEIGSWMKPNHEAIYGTSASPFDQLDWGRCTQKRIDGNTRLFLHVFEWPEDGKLVVPGLANKPVNVFLLDGGNTLESLVTQNRVTIDVTRVTPKPYATVVVLDIQGAPEIVKPDPYADETAPERDARMRWWRDARFGMFIHWGVYAVPAGNYDGRRIKGIGEWIMNRGKIPVATYRQYARDFNPTNYDAEAWVKLAKEAGMKYIIITSKHHDGFALFDSNASDWNIVQATPYGKDLLQPLADACRKHGLKLGFYYSQAQDWNNGGSASGGKWDPVQERDMDDYIDNVAVPQMREILTRYGEFPAVLWWDTPTDMNKERAEKLLPLLKLKPGIIHNNRLGGGYQGDTETPEQHIPATGYPGRDWETCMTMNDTWGFKNYDQNWKSTETLIHNLVDIASKGGNYLLNVGPTSDGCIPDPSIERLRAVGAWMKVNGEAIYGTSASPFKRQPWGRCTTKPGTQKTTLYLHVFNWPVDGRLVVPGLKNPVASAQLLATGDPLRAFATEDGVVVIVPATAPDPVSSTVVLRINGDPEIGVVPLLQEPDGSVILMASEASLHGGLRYEIGGGKDNIGFWTNPEDWAEWDLKITEPGRMKVVAEIAAENAGTFIISVNGQNLAGASPKTDSYTQFERVELGTLDFPDGKISVEVRPVKDGWHPMNLKSITLTPAK